MYCVCVRDVCVCYVYTVCWRKRQLVQVTPGVCVLCGRVEMCECLCRCVLMSVCVRVCVGTHLYICVRIHIPETCM